MDYSQEYKQKLVSADEAVKLIKSGDWVDYGWCNGTVDRLLFLPARTPVNISHGTPGICPVSNEN